ncbi:hypothetical protein Rhopal_007468-T1 [Rhodotorula paludigena]|uniref:Major facilitator superfamily (MFS) profile domain-containing protein n=1 Tax=Rhodotorula paludigena TaxID=86838 RepID=A0AAV5H0Y1_9BASI|nr:hypothetical protein Rhopal_007468-T1 [Rhodotorula paludigena]
MAALERTTSHVSMRSERSRRAYAGGAGLGGKVSRRGPLVVGREGRIEEDSEAVTVDEEAAVGEKNEAVQETVDRAEAMQITEDLNTSATVINVTVAIFILCIDGRRPVYIVSLPIFALGAMGTALSQSLAALIVTRILQAFGSSPVLSVGAGTIGDLYSKHERGTAMGLFYLGVLVGPATAPAVAGILTEYVQPAGTGWRAMQWLLMALGWSAFLVVLFAFPETAHVKGVDVIRQERLQARADKAGVTIEMMHQKEMEKRREMGLVRRRWDSLVWVWLNPITPLRLLIHPHVLAIVCLPGVLLCFGNAVASRYTGKYADWTLRRWLKKKNGHYYPEDRLRASIIGGAGILPCSVLALGWVLDKGSGKCVLTPSNTYIVDALPMRSSEGIAVNNACRYVLSAAASAFVLPMIKAIGVGWTNTFAAFVVWLGCGLVLLTIRYGDQMRAAGTRWEGGEDLTSSSPPPAQAPGAEDGAEKAALTRRQLR